MSAFQRLEPSRGPVVLLLAAYASVLFIAGCSPSLDEAKQVLQERIASESEGHIKLVSFMIVDVQENQAGAMQGRRINYAAEIEFDHNGVWSRGVGNESLRFEFSPNERSKLTRGNVADVTNAMMNDLQGDRQMNKGDRTKIVGVMTGTKSENGWRYELNQSRTID